MLRSLSFIDSQPMRCLSFSSLSSLSRFRLIFHYIVLYTAIRLSCFLFVRPYVHFTASLFSCLSICLFVRPIALRFLCPLHHCCYWFVHSPVNIFNSLFILLQFSIYSTFRKSSLANLLPDHLIMLPSYK